MAKSTFSIVAALLAGPKQVRIYPPKPGDLFEHGAAGKDWLISTLAGVVDEAELDRQVQQKLRGR